uniref:Uncharacterized protein n=1 Tax=Gossypium raimondii TaxID=29730 RepID=A0A0D2R6R1_GOSRA|nr:hypothetical protein B456_005G000900 [Gossypium raimondii]
MSTDTEQIKSIYGHNSDSPEEDDKEDHVNIDLAWESDEVEAISSLFQGRIPQNLYGMNRATAGLTINSHGRMERQETRDRKKNKQNSNKEEKEVMLSSISEDDHKINS